MANVITDILIAGIGLAETAVYFLALVGLLRHGGCTLAEAGASAALVLVMLVSFLLQIAFITGVPALSGIMRLTFLAAAAFLAWRHRGDLRGDGRALVHFTRNHPLAVAGLLGLLSALAVAAALSGGYGHTVDLSGFLGTALPGDAMPAPLNAAILMSTTTKVFYLPGAGLSAWWAYLSICLATYALARRYAWPPTAITVTLLVASMPRLVFLAVAGALEIVPAAAALLFILVLYRTVERPGIRDFLLLPVVLAFSISGDRLCLLFPAIGLALALVLLSRRHGGRFWWDLLRQAPLSLAAVAPPLFIFSQGWVFVRNGLAGQHWAGDGQSIVWAYNPDGLSGWAANLLRYGLQVVDLTPPLEQVLEKSLGFSWFASRVWIHDRLLAPVFNHDGLVSAAPFTVTPDGGAAWFGPLAGLLILPALVWALARGPRRLKTIALALLAYFFLVALIPAWMPDNVRYFTTFFVCAGFTTAFLLPPWRMTRHRRRFLQIAAVALMVYAVGTIYRLMLMNALPG